ncbi:MBL fold metallo-hydrolase [Zavarzinia compransoris]|uniref:Metallo-beta-lactamase domain-containing protein n=1 Tax=Zavarzinia compransoris TaxID=1264899 RepID=A0A317E1N6_9PROT|nr:MBL fold metallo-hydrolase [Zavarzinia compransoris]PWR21007.1 hypothetical protein DKG75_13550 [Zavarzinia compransoris]TDP44039.1 metallo-beta-lactamase superfamily protein [Zavarzinia compransoris]
MPGGTTGASAVGAVTIRMYRGILGDCFLLTYAAGGSDRRILIDCGVLQAVTGAKDRIVAIVEDIRRTTGGIIDLLVLTHEHADHISGIAHAWPCFCDQLTIRELWLAWTENVHDDQAKTLGVQLAQGKEALKLVQQFGMMGAADTPALRTVIELGRFITVIDDEPPAGPPSRPRPRTGNAIMEAMKAKVGAPATRYLEPGQVVRAASGGIKAHVLGPPRTTHRLKNDAPRKGAGREVYLTSLDETLAVASAAKARLLARAADLGAAPATAAGGDAVADPPPFGRRHGRAPGVRADHIEKTYNRTVADFDRRIDDEWLGAAESLALKMDSDVNNTSLVLAFELSDGQILLFPGDAQVGNWLSWGDQTYPAAATAEIPFPATVNDILGRVTFYKVGHHCSHNATLSALGLELMTDPRLVAAIPVVEEIAKGKGKNWNMPYPHLYQRLREKTRDRVVRGDGDRQAEAAAFAAVGDPGAARYQSTELWVEITVTAATA